MARKPRVDVERGLYHVITRGNNRRRIFEAPDDYQKFLSLLEIPKNRLPFFLYAYCLMTNHVHLLIERQATPISRIMHRVTDARGATASYTYNNGRHLVNQIDFTSPGGVPATPSVSFGYDAAGNRTSITDGLGSVSYVRNSLSQMISETRNFNDPVAPFLNASYTLSYDYNLVGEMKKITVQFVNRLHL